MKVKERNRSTKTKTGIKTSKPKYFQKRKKKNQTDPICTGLLKMATCFYTINPKIKQTTPLAKPYDKR
jgi:hypothetical protein